MSVTELKVAEGCMAWAHNYELTNEQEKGLIADLTSAIAYGFNLIGVPAFSLEMEEFNRTTNETTMRFKMVRTTPEGTCVLGIITPRTLFETTSKQSYHATNHDNSKLDYDGEFRVNIILNGIWNDAKKCNGQNEIAEIALKLASGYYYEKILQHYPEWSTDYRDAPIPVTHPVEHL